MRSRLAGGQRRGGLGAIAAPPTITTASLAAGSTGVYYSATLAASGGKAPYAWTIASGSLPTGLALSSAGIITGTPAASGAPSVTFRCTGANGKHVDKTLTLTVGVVIPYTAADARPKAMPGRRGRNRISAPSVIAIGA